MRSVRWPYFGGVTTLFLTAFFSYIVSSQSAQLATNPKAVSVVDEIGALKVENEDQAAVKNLLINSIKKGWEAFDRSRIENILSDNFEFWYLVDDDLVFKQTRDDYLQKRSGWTKDTHVAKREMLFSRPEFLQGAPHVPENTISVAAVITYRSQYFNPRFLCVYSFEQRDSAWLLVKEVAVALHPSRPEDHEVQILVGEPRPDRPEHLDVHEIMNSFGHDQVVTSYLSDIYEDGFKADGRRKRVLMLFREPPKNGAEITVESIYRWANKRRYFKFKTVATGGDPWFYIVRSSRCNSPCRVTYKVYVEDTLVHEQTIFGR